jgi:hypothetical protein
MKFHGYSNTATQLYAANNSCIKLAAAPKKNQLNPWIYSVYIFSTSNIQQQAGWIRWTSQKPEEQTADS